MAADDLNEYIQHVGSALYAIPPGVRGQGRLVGPGAVLVSGRDLLCSATI
nr:Dyp-type peroxidase [Streptomyces wuyuanensis]